MAQLKDSMITGNLRVTDTIYTDTVQVDTIKTHTASDTSAVGPGTDGQILKTNGTSSYWGNVNLDDVADGSTRKLSNYAPIDSPELTGTPTAPTATAGTNNTQIATTEFVNNAVNTAAGSVYRVKGTKTDYASLPSSGNIAGDVWNVTSAYGNYPAGTNWVWTGNEWDALGGEIDLSSKQDVLTFDTIPTENSTNPVTSGGIYNAITENEEVVAAALNDLNDRMLEAESSLSDLNKGNQKSIIGVVDEENHPDPFTNTYLSAYPAPEGSILSFGNCEYTDGETEEYENMNTSFWPSSTCKFLVWQGIRNAECRIMFFEPGTYYLFDATPDSIDSSYGANSYTEYHPITITSTDLQYADEYQEGASDGTYTTRPFTSSWDGHIYLYYSGNTAPNVKIAYFGDQYRMYKGKWEYYHFPKEGIVGPSGYAPNSRFTIYDFPSGVTVWNAIHPQVYTYLPSNRVLPNILNRLGTITGSKTWYLADAAFMQSGGYVYDSNTANHYFWTFETGATPPTITWPTGLIWPGGSPPAILPNKHYEISVLNNIVAWMEV